MFQKYGSEGSAHRKAAKGAEGVIFLKRRERRRFKKHPLMGSRNIYRVAAEWLSFAGVSAANETIKLFAASAA